MSCGKSVRRDEVHSSFDGVLEGLTPSQPSLGLFQTIFAKVWDAQAKQVGAMKMQLNRKITGIDKQINALLDNIVKLSNDRVITSFEAKIDKLEREKLVLSEKAATLAKPRHTFNEMFELALAFLANPQKHWENGSLASRKTLLKLAFDAPLTYKRNEGFRTPQTSSIFKALSNITSAN